MYDPVGHAPAASLEREEFFSIGDLARAVRKRLWLVFLVAALCMGAAVAASLLRPPVYEATATVVVSPTEGANAQENLSNQIGGLQVLAHEMAVAGLNPSMVQEVINAQGGQPTTSDLAENLTVAQIEDTRYLTLAYRSDERAEARAVANGAAKIFAKEAPAASGMGGAAALNVSAYAREPAALEGPDPVRNGLLALALGLMLGTGLAFVLERFGGGLSPAEVERDSGVPNLAVVPDFDRGKRVSR
jgi:capsular polysaccharide biosynthesis protein